VSALLAGSRTAPCIGEEKDCVGLACWLKNCATPWRRKGRDGLCRHHLLARRLRLPLTVGMPAVPRIGEGENCIDSLSGSRTAARLDIGYAWGSTR
jgi:hypothetical protein